MARAHHPTPLPLIRRHNPKGTSMSDNAPGGQGDATSEIVWRDRGVIIDQQQKRIAELEREILDRDATETDARSRLAVAEAEVERLRKGIDGLRALIRTHADDAREDVEHWGSYAGDYFAEKWDLAGDIAKWEARRDA